MFKDSDYSPNTFFGDYQKRLKEEKEKSDAGKPLWARTSPLPSFSATGSSNTTAKTQSNTNSSAKAASDAISRIGSEIKTKVKSVLSKKYGELDTRHLFDDIDDKDIEDNIETAENTIKTNIDIGALNKSLLTKLPNLRDGLALSYAAANKGNNKEATKAREAAYMETEPLVKETDSRLLYNSLAKKNNANAENTAKNEIKPPETSLYSNRSKENLPKTGVRFKAETSGNTTTNKTVPDFDSIAKKIPPKYSIAAELQRQEKEKNNQQFNNVSDEQKKYYEISEKEDITAAHARVKTYAEQWKDVPEYKWTLGDIAKWKTTGGEEFIHQKKLGFIKNYKDVILDAAKKYDLPPILLAGVAYIEYGGKPTMADDIAYYGRIINKYLPNIVDTTFDKDPKLTSFGNTSIQIRRAAETLGYSSYKNGDMIKILEDPIQNIFVTAAHLNDLRNIDYLGKSADELTDDEIKIIASRYNIGPQYKKESILTPYGEEIYEKQADIMKSFQ